MEIEYKWELTDEQAAREVAAHCREAVQAQGPREKTLLATYYDTPDLWMKELHGALRLRTENGVGVCCMKLAAKGQQDGYKAREEYEVQAETLEEGLRLLPGAGAPADLCQQLLESELVPTAQTDFTRHAYELSCAGEHGTFSAELAIDGGFLRNGPKEAALHELELEFVEGSEEAFHAFAKDLETRFGLKVQPLSKLARAVAL